MKQEVLMRLADNCYRIENIDTGLQYLEQLETDIKPRGFYIISLLKGKYMDHQKKFSEAASEFEKALSLYNQDAKQESSVKGNILFRLGWAMIRSRKNIDKGISTLEEANDNLVENIDLKIKLSQILFQEKQDNKKSLKIIKQALDIDSNNVDALLLQGKILVKDKQGKEAIEVLERSVKVQCTSTDEFPKSSTFFYLGQAFEGLKEFKKCILNYKKCLQIDQNHFGACIYLANLLANLAEG